MTKEDEEASVNYCVNKPLTVEEFIDLLECSKLASRRPVADKQCIAGMLTHSNLLVSAWDGMKLIGVARSISDFHYACYLSDLAVDQAYQSRGIGKELQNITQKQLGKKCKLILIAAPAANAYYRKIGYTQNERCWVLEPSDSIVP